MAPADALHRAPLHDGGRGMLAVTASVAIAFPVLIAFNVSPSATFLNQAASFVGWGVFLLVLGASIPSRSRPRSHGALALVAAMTLLFVLALLASLWRSVPWSISLSLAGSIASAILAIAMGAAATRSGLGDRAFRAVCIALVVAGVGCSVVAFIQVFMPGLPDGVWIAPSAIPGRATGNLRQPNHLSSLLLWSAVGAVWLGERRALPRPIALALMLVFVAGVMLSGSRTGAIGVLTLAGWGLLDRRLSRAARLALIAAPLVYLLLWWGTNQALHPGARAVGAGVRIAGSSMFETYTRFSIWVTAISLIASHPWLGVGFGEFNFAWTLTPFPNRPIEFFDHAHNIVLQFAAELGIPLALLVLGLFLYAMWQALRHALADGRAHFPASSLLTPTAREDAAKVTGSMQRAAFVIVLMAGMHSMLEYPLWYAYFLLPTAFVFGLALERPAGGASHDVEVNVTRPFVLAAMFLILGGSLALYDYTRVVVIFEPPIGAGPLEDRIAAGRKSVLFSHHADYAEATSEDPADTSMAVFSRAPHYLLDSRLMMAWAKALDAHGETDKARHVAARLKEFRSEAAAEFFAPCGDDKSSAKSAAAAQGTAATSAALAESPAMASATTPSAPSGPTTTTTTTTPFTPITAAAALPFQCQAPTRLYRFEDFL